MRDKTLYLNGRPTREPFARYIDREGDAIHPGMRWQSNHLIAAPTEYHPSRDNWGPLVVPEERYFVLGDNRDNSEDSRYWGFVEESSIRGRPWMVYYSFDMYDEDPWGWIKSVRWGRIGEQIR